MFEHLECNPINIAFIHVTSSSPHLTVPGGLGWCAWLQYSFLLNQAIVWARINGTLKREGNNSLLFTKETDGGMDRLKVADIFLMQYSMYTCVTLTPYIKGPPGII